MKSRLHAALTAARATEPYRCFLLDRLDGLAAVPGITRVVAFTPPSARAQLPTWLDVDTEAAPHRLRDALQPGDTGPARTAAFARGLGR